MTEPKQIVEFSIQNPPETPFLDWVQEGTKLFEGRKQSNPKLVNLFPGDKIKLYDRDNHKSFVICEVTEFKYYNNFGEAFDDLGEKLIPKGNRNDVIRMYNKLYEKDIFYPDGITSKIISDAKVVAIGIKLI